MPAFFLSQKPSRLTPMNRTLLPTEQTTPTLHIALLIGGIIGAAGVMLLALSAHADTTGLLKTAAQMLLFHAPAFLALGVLSQIRRVILLRVSLALLFVGLTLFCGDLVTRVFSGQRLFPMAAPTGGVLTILGWFMIAFGALRIQPR